MEMASEGILHWMHSEIEVLRIISESKENEIMRGKTSGSHSREYENGSLL
jgi:hypothetical protein